MPNWYKTRRSWVQDVGDFPLDTRLYEYNDGDAHTIGDALEHVCVLGRTGAGKSSGPGRAFAVSYLAAGFGGLVLCAKPEERITWEKYAKEAGREKDLRFFNPEEPWRFNFFNYEYSRGGRGAGRTVNLHQLLMTVVEAVQSGGEGGDGENAFWKYTMDQLVRRSIDLITLAGEEPTLEKIYDLVSSAPTKPGLTGGKPKEGTPEWRWQMTSYCYKLLGAVYQRRKKLKQHEDAWAEYEKQRKMSREDLQAYLDSGAKRASVPMDEAPMSEQERRDWRVTRTYWAHEFPGLSDRTRSVVVSYMTSALDLLLTGDLGELFGTTTNLTPEACFKGAIIIVDLPTLEFFDLGKMAAYIWKYMLQRAILSREVDRDSTPVFLWADEAHQFLSSFDQEFMAQCRSKLGAVVYLAQNIPQFKNALGGTSMERVRSLIGNFKTLVFMANNETDTNEFAANLIGKSWMVHPTISMKSGNPSNEDFVPRAGANLHQSERYEVQPNEFTKLRTGGSRNEFVVEAIVFRGEEWADDSSFLNAYFAQR